MRDWLNVLVPEAARIVASYSTPVTLRQVHYRLVASGVGGYVNTKSDYTQLSDRTAEARRMGTFPVLLDMNREADIRDAWDGPAPFLSDVADWYQRDLTEGQKDQHWVIYEKGTLRAQVRDWLDPYGIPSAACRGYSSESLEREVFGAMMLDQRPLHVLYVGDHDATGVDIDRNFVTQARRYGLRFASFTRVAVLDSQIASLGLAPAPGKATDSRAAAFMAKHGSNVQVEVEAIDPNILQALVMRPIDRRWNKAAHKRAVHKELDERSEIRTLLEAQP